MKIPTDQETPEEFISRVVALLSLPDTHLYFDTNVLVWVTLLAPAARAQFLSLLDSIKAPAHVPTWAMNEFYRLHRSKHLHYQLNTAADALTRSIKEFSSETKRYGAQFPSAGTSFLDRVKRMTEEASELKRIAGAWNYEHAARVTIDWMNGIACEKGIDFQFLAELKGVGSARYSHDVPPGYKDDHKKKREGRGTNRFGDLLFWQEVLAHSSMIGAKTVIVVTNDRKEDWYYDQGNPAVGVGLRQLGVSRWEPVPCPHPLLAYEIESVSRAELALVDPLYLGAIAWHLDKKNFRHLVGAALAISEESMVRAEAASVPPPIKPGGSLTSVQATDLLRDAFAAPSPTVGDTLATVDSEAPIADALIASIDEPYIQDMTETDTVILARHLAKLAIANHAMAALAIKRLVELLSTVQPDHAASIHLGLAVASYYDDTKPRPIPLGFWLDTLATYQGCPAMQQTVAKLNKKLVKDSSPALYLLNDQDLPCEIRLDVDTRRQQDPAELSGACINGKAVLTNDSMQGSALRDLVGEPVATTTQIVDALCAYLGVPHVKAKFENAEVRHSIPEGLFVVCTTRLDMMLGKQAPIPGLPFEIGNSGLDDEELVDATDIEPDDDDVTATVTAGSEGIRE